MSKSYRVTATTKTERAIHKAGRDKNHKRYRRGLIVVALALAACSDVDQLGESSGELKSQPDAGVDAPAVCWTFRASHCETTNHVIEQICVPYDGCGCYRCEPGNNGKGHAYGQRDYCYCGPGLFQ